jgi:hypothetical protein
MQETTNNITTLSQWLSSSAFSMSFQRGASTHQAIGRRSFVGQIRPEEGKAGDVQDLWCGSALYRSRCGLGATEKLSSCSGADGLALLLRGGQGRERWPLQISVDSC